MSTLKDEELAEFIGGLDLASMTIDTKAFTEAMLKLGLPCFPCTDKGLEMWIVTMRTRLAILGISITDPISITCESLRLYARVRLGVINGQINI